jgi:hypothetical protein
MQDFAGCGKRVLQLPKSCKIPKKSHKFESANPLPETPVMGPHLKRRAIQYRGLLSSIELRAFLPIGRQPLYCNTFTLHRSELRVAGHNWNSTIGS